MTVMECQMVDSTVYQFEELVSLPVTIPQNFTLNPRLIPGKDYLATVFQLERQATSQECLAFLRQLGAILVGESGLALVLKLRGDSLPDKKFIASFDEEEKLPHFCDGSHRVPCACHLKDHWERVELGFEPCKYDHWPLGHFGYICLLAFLEKNEA